LRWAGRLERAEAGRAAEAAGGLCRPQRRRQGLRSLAALMAVRRFPPPWTVDDPDESGRRSIFPYGGLIPAYFSALAPSCRALLILMISFRCCKSAGVPATDKGEFVGARLTFHGCPIAVRCWRIGTSAPAGAPLAGVSLSAGIEGGRPLWPSCRHERS
jgi:hypothetical protein